MKLNPQVELYPWQYGILKTTTSSKTKWDCFEIRLFEVIRPSGNILLVE